MGQVGGCRGNVGLGGGRFRTSTGGVWGTCSPSLVGLPDRPPAPPTQGTFQQMWISKQEYEEGGKQCVERKCP